MCATANADDGRLNAMVFMPKYVPDPGDLGPRNIWMSRFLGLGNRSAGFRDDLQSALDGALHQPALAETRQIAVNQRVINAGEGFGDVLKPNTSIAHRLKTP